jgi:hypothetical protein
MFSSRCGRVCRTGRTQCAPPDGQAANRTGSVFTAAFYLRTSRGGGLFVVKDHQVRGWFFTAPRVFAFLPAAGCGIFPLFLRRQAASRPLAKAIGLFTPLYGVITSVCFIPVVVFSVFPACLWLCVLPCIDALFVLVHRHLGALSSRVMIPIASVLRWERSASDLQPLEFNLSRLLNVLMPEIPARDLHKPSLDLCLFA